MVSHSDPDAASTNGDARRAPGAFSSLTALRDLIAGLLMGIANLIPGVSGGTMILAMGVYEEFIDSVADVTALRFSWRRIVFLGLVGGAAACAIVGLAGVILYLLFHYTIAMFSLFIGLTLGGAPLLMRSLRPVRGDVVVAVLAGVGLMVGVFCLKGSMGFPRNTAMDFASGVVGSTTMVLPGISGSYMLLVMDQYDRVVGSVRDLKDGVSGHDSALIKGALKVAIPVGIGAIVGIVVLSNVLKILLHRFHRPTVGTLLGILLGSVLGLWPFSQVVGEKALEGRSVAEIREYAEKWSIPGVAEHSSDKASLISHVTDADVWAQRITPPVTAHGVGVSIGFVLAGFAMTCALSRLGGGVGAGREPVSDADSGANQA